MAHSNGETERGESISENGNHNAFTRTQHKWCKILETPVNGDKLTGKGNNMIRTFFENVDGFVVPNKDKIEIKNKNKQSYLNNLLHRLEIDMIGGSETR